MPLEERKPGTREKGEGSLGLELGGAGNHKPYRYSVIARGGNP